MYVIIYRMNICLCMRLGKYTRCAFRKTSFYAFVSASERIIARAIVVYILHQQQQHQQIQFAVLKLKGSVVIIYIFNQRSYIYVLHTYMYTKTVRNMHPSFMRHWFCVYFIYTHKHANGYTSD